MSQANLVCSLTPSGRIDLRVESADDETPAPSGSSKRIIAAFERGRGQGVLHLGAAALSSDLDPTLAFWRDLGRTYVARACAAIDPLEPALFVAPTITADELAEQARGVPPMRGAELLDAELLAAVWHDLDEALAELASKKNGGVGAYLAEQSSLWNVVGRVNLHLAENKRDPELPFAFIATYVHAVSKQSKAQHLPLGRALQQYAGAKNRKKLLALLEPLSRAVEKSELLRELFESGDIYHPLSWTASEAYQFLCEVELYEQAGLVVRVPDWWSARQRPRPKVSVEVGAKAPSTLGMKALLDFDVTLTLDNDELTPEELEAILSSGESLVLLKGKWVEVDSAMLRQVLGQWRDVQREAREGGVGFGEAMRLLAGAELGGIADPAEAETPQWSEVIAGEWLAEQLAALRAPRTSGELGDGDENAGLQAELRPYQRVGVEWLETLRRLELGGCLADDMGLGKTIQVLGLFSLCKMAGEKGTDLLVVPASLLENWRQEMTRFAPHLRALVAHPSQLAPAKLKKLTKKTVAGYDAVITTYGTVLRSEWMKGFPWRTVLLDEAQAIKNPNAKQTKAVKSLDACWRLALTGTPVENRLGDLWSIFDFLNPGLLGSAKAFNELSRAMAKRPGGYAPLRELVRPYILRRLKTDKRVIDDLPDKTELSAYCRLSKRQAALYQQSVNALVESLRELEGIERRGVVLSFLMRFKQICNHPSQWLGDGEYNPEHSGKLARLRELCEPIAARQDKVLVFTQFREMTAPLADFLAQVFGQPGLVLHGGTPVKKRQGLVKRFQTEDSAPFMVLSLKAGGTGLNLTAASHVIHFDRWWNPAVESQATDRAFRIGQKRNVLVHKFLCRGTVEERIDELIRSKQQLADEVLTSGAETKLTELSDEELMAMVSLDLERAVAQD